MAVKIDSRFATADETANVLGVSSRRVKQLAKLVAASLKTRWGNGIPRTAPTGGLKGHVVARAGTEGQKTKTFAKKSSAGSLGTGSPKNFNSPRRKSRRGKKSKAAR
jgi:hypothetical protein